MLSAAGYMENVNAQGWLFPFLLYFLEVQRKNSVEKYEHTSLKVASGFFPDTFCPKFHCCFQLQTVSEGILKG